MPGEQVSVMPQPLLSFMPTLRSRILATSTGSGAPPDPTLTSDDRSRLSRSGRAAIAIHIVGTPGNAVARLTSMSRITASTSKRWCSEIRLPRARLLSITTVSAKIWNSGSTQITRSMASRSARAGLPQTS